MLATIQFRILCLLVCNVKIKIYKIIISPIFSYGCETWCLTLRQEHRLWVFEKRMLRRTSEEKRDESLGDWRKLHNEELRNLRSPPSIMKLMKTRRMRWPGHVACTETKKNAYRI
jgi:hypothetical protein